MKICWLIYDRANYTSGPTVNAVRLLPVLQKRGYEILLLVGHNGDGTPNADLLEENGITCFKYIVPYFSEDHVKIILQAISGYAPDIFVSNISAQAAIAGRWIQKWGIPVVHTHRSDDVLNNGMAKFFFAGPKKWRLSALVSVNRFLLDKTKSSGADPFLAKVIPSGVSIPEFKTNQYGVRRLKVVYAGRIIQAQKRVDDMVSAFIKTVRTSEVVDFTLIGHGDISLIQHLKTKISTLGMDGRIRFIERLEGESYKKELANHHVIVLLSDYEGTPGSVMDGMSCGLIPVVLKINGIEELVQHHYNGLVVGDRDREFVRAIVSLAGDEQLRIKLSENARETIRKKFSLDYAAGQWDELFHELSRKKTRKSIKIPARLTLPPETSLLPEHRKRPGFKKKLLGKIEQIKHAIR